MKKKSVSQSAFFNLRLGVGFVLCLAGFFLALLALGIFSGAPARAEAPKENSGIQFGQSYHNDVSPALRDLPTMWPPPESNGEKEELREANLNPKLPLPLHMD